MNEYNHRLCHQLLGLLEKDCINQHTVEKVIEKHQNTCKKKIHDMNMNRPLPAQAQQVQAHYEEMLTEIKQEFKKMFRELQATGKK